MQKNRGDNFSAECAVHDVWKAFVLFPGNY